MTSATQTLAFEYNADGMRTKKTNADGVSEYYYHGTQLVHIKRTEGNTTSNLHFYYNAEGKPAMVKYNGAYYVYVTNLQGDIIGIADNTKAWVVRYRYDAWGKHTHMYGTMRNTLGKLNPFRYRGYVFDEETGDYWLRSRYYRPLWGRFLNADALVKGNLYCYCENDPINSEDRSGLTPCAAGIFGDDGDEDWFLFEESYNRYIRAHEVNSIINSYQPVGYSITVDGLFRNFDLFIERKTRFDGEGDTGCGVAVRAGILSEFGRYSNDDYSGGASSIFNYDSIVNGLISEIGMAALIPGMLLGTRGKTNKYPVYNVEHIGVYAGLHDFKKGKGPEPAVYSYNTRLKRFNLLPFNKNEWVYFGWHRAIVHE